MIIGAITRLTDSGLSIVEWDLIMGTIPPLSHNDWSDLFDKYKEFPQYELSNESTTLSGFKSIFWWEYIHRLLGRMIGAVLIIQFIVFLIRKKLSRAMIKKYIVAIILLGIVGTWGWFMVMSGLIDRPSVSPYRLTVHLLLASSLLLFLFWFAMELRDVQRGFQNNALRKLALWITALLVLQFFYGGFMLGLKAASFFPTYPLMQGALIPDSIMKDTPKWRNLFENPAMVQLIHRTLPLIIGVFIIVFRFRITRLIDDAGVVLGISANLLLVIFLIQFILGIVTLLSARTGISINLAVAHQAVALLLLLTAVSINYRFSKS